MTGSPDTRSPDNSSPDTRSRDAIVQEIFADVVLLPASDQASSTERACAGDASLQREVMMLLAAHRVAGAFLSQPAARLDDVFPNADEFVGTKIGRYQLIEVLGEGGFGTVYRARQDAPIRRDVALKIIKLGMDTRQVITRFDLERQALAILDHPNIATVFEAGATDNGRPYFVMELVEGVPITVYCDQKNLSTRQRLELVVPICKALHHAHQKGIIHRDIKPNNILITKRDGVAMPKIIDFGIAKATQSKLTNQTLFTEVRQMIGTPAYMSPEQACIDARDIDTRSDLYSIGVLLYELLTGTTPIEDRTLRSAAYEQMQKMIREVEPPAPSTRMTTLGDRGASVAATRNVDLKALSRSVRGEVDWIVMRCLEKARDRRYQSAEALGDDLERHLRGDEVHARPATRAYRARKFIRRHALSLGVGSLLLSILVGALVMTSVALARESRARALADQANDEALGAIKSAVGWYGKDRPTVLLRKHYESLRVAYGDDNRLTIDALNTLCRGLEQDGYMDEDEKLLLVNIERARRVCGPHSGSYLGAVEYMITCLNDQKRFEDAVPYCKLLFEIVDSDEVPPGTAGYYCRWWGDTLRQMQHHSEAREPLLGALRILQTRDPAAHGAARDVYYALSEGAEAMGDSQQAALWRGKAYAEARAEAQDGKPTSRAALAADQTARP